MRKLLIKSTYNLAYWFYAAELRKPAEDRIINVYIKYIHALLIRTKENISCTQCWDAYTAIYYLPKYGEANNIQNILWV